MTSKMEIFAKDFDDFRSKCERKWFNQGKSDEENIYLLGNYNYLSY